MASKPVRKKAGAKPAGSRKAGDPDKRGNQGKPGNKGKRKSGSGRLGSSGKPGSGPSPDDIKTKLLTHKNPSVAKGISDAAVIKDGDVFLVTDRDGAIPPEGKHGFGLYYHDCRYLSGYLLRLEGKSLHGLTASTEEGFRAEYQLANPGLTLEKDIKVREQTIGLRWTHLLSQEELALLDGLDLHNYGQKRVRFGLTLEFRADFLDVFNIRGLDDRHPGKQARPAWKGGALLFAYHGADGLERKLSIRPLTRPRKRSGTTLEYRIDLPPGETAALELAFLLEAEGNPKGASRKSKDLPARQELSSRYQESRGSNISEGAEADSDSALLTRVIGQSLKDLRSLKSRYDGLEYYSAGIPWFAAMFGRDALITCLQTLAFFPAVSRDTLRLFARYQGSKVDDWTEEQPGRILHELRRGELARAGLIPYTPFYGTIDATALFLILLARHAAWTGSLDLFRELRGSVDLAMEWMDRYGDANGDGYVEYRTPDNGSQINQGWKDAGDAIVNADGSLAKSPISLVEVQGYVHLAKLEVAGLMRRNGEEDAAAGIEASACELRERFNRDFWIEKEQYFAMALQDGGRHVASVGSNPGQALWGGIVEPSKAARVKERLFREDMYSGWGIRTLASGEVGYNPMGYHLGTVWPHDNSLIADGLRRYGFDTEAMRIFEGIFEAAGTFREGRLPELFCGFDRSEFLEPVKYPIANHPQAWASGSLPFMLATMLGLQPEAFEGRLRIVRPMLPGAADWIELRRLRVGRARVDLRFERSGDGVAVRESGRQGDLEIIVEGAR